MGTRRPKEVNVDELTRKLLLRDEGCRLRAYQDHLGYWTIGVGRLIDPRRGGGITRDEAEYLLSNDLARIEAELVARLPWFAGLDPVRQTVFRSMAFQLGVSGLTGFTHTLRAAEAGQWDKAASAMLTSRWAQQTPLRAHRLAEAVRTGDPAAFRLDEDGPDR